MKLTLIFNYTKLYFGILMKFNYSRKLYCNIFIQVIIILKLYNGLSNSVSQQVELNKMSVIKI